MTLKGTERGIKVRPMGFAARPNFSRVLVCQAAGSERSGIVAGGSIVPEKKAFWVRCEPHNPRDSPIGLGGFSAYIGQRVRNNGIEQVWDSVVIHGDEEADGTLAIRVLVSNPDWASLLQIACIRSRPDDRDSLIALGCNLDHISISRASP